MTLSGIRDPGLQPERTAIAWQRTMLTALGAAIVCARTAADTSSPFLILTTGMMLATICVSGFGFIVRSNRCFENPSDPRTQVVGLVKLLSSTVAVGGGAYLLALTQ
ncbi:hypothetical protein BKP42_59060 [Rhodococcus erythropolis]|uniref:DUF202 domain-containing protein n=1 Tax=Rhodococcus erythropolis TaxID=1833 RepID=UPI00117A0F03|nr:DUF202 domain-containing protein [Rhodococcus erythropolis]PBI88812.1 hypothetical protein BKP42_59060 [Rhodococcus erythropolis]